MEAIIEIDKLHIDYFISRKRFVAVKDFTLSVAGLEFLTIAGLSGCGKTTVLNSIAGFLKPTSGSIRFEGRDIVKPSADRVVAFQEDAVFPWYTVKQNIAYALEMKGVNHEEKRKITENYLNLVGLTAFADYFPKDLSGGMKKRVDLARAYAANPKVLLMDEPFGALDTYTRQQMQLQLLNLHESEKKTILFVTHDIREAVFLSDRIVLMTPSPGSVFKIFQIPFKRPRKLEIKKTIEFIKLHDEIEDLLHLQEKPNEQAGKQ